jgi:hypothetical protein
MGLDLSDEFFQPRDVVPDAASSSKNSLHDVTLSAGAVEGGFVVAIAESVAREVVVATVTGAVVTSTRIAVSQQRSDAVELFVVGYTHRGGFAELVAAFEEPGATKRPPCGHLSRVHTYSRSSTHFVPSATSFSSSVTLHNVASTDAHNAAASSCRKFPPL